MQAPYRLIDHYTESPKAPLLEAVSPDAKRLICVMPLAYRGEGKSCFYPNVQVTALNVAFQLARKEIERTLCANNPELADWFIDKGQVWPYLVKNGHKPANEDFDLALKRAKDLVRVVVLLDSSDEPIPMLSHAEFLVTPYSHQDVTYMEVNALQNTCDSFILFVYELDQFTSQAKTTINAFPYTKVNFYEIVNLTNQSGDNCVYHST